MTTGQKPFAFVLMPFDASFDDIYKLGIKSTAEALGFVAERVDDQKFSEDILSRICRQIELADVIISDMTGRNPNVFYEVGYAHARGKLSIHLASSIEDIPFDLKHKRHLIYGRSITSLQDKLKDELIWAQKQIANTSGLRISVKPKQISGLLSRDKYYATGQLTFTIDLHNETEQSSPEIEAIYFYSVRRWDISQAGQQCPYTNSDLSGYNFRYSINIPHKKLHKQMWTQIQLIATILLYSALGGKELKDSYKISGKGIIRFVTQHGVFDYEIPIDTTVDEFPF